MSNKVLSKSRLQKGFQCPKSLMLAILQPELESEADASTEQRFSDGSYIGELARKEFPGGVLIEGDYYDFDGFLARTEAAIAKGEKVIFEAAFRWRSFFFRADILKRAPKGEWDLIEVKMSNSVKDTHLTDLAIQRVIAEGAGFKVRKTILMHLNGECEFPDLSNLFEQEDLTDDVMEILEDTRTGMLRLEKLKEKGKVPEQDIGSHCEAPYSCGFKAHCWKHVPSPSIFDIPKIKPWPFYEKKVLTIQQLAKEKLPAAVQIFVKSHLNRKRFVNSEEIKAEIGTWKWPLTLLDFETISFPVPRIPGTVPYQKVPFQFACSVWEKLDGKVEEVDFLDVESLDPREAIARHLAEKLPTKGSVVAFSKGFESGVLGKLAELYPKYKKRLLSLQERLVDPLPILRNCVYDPGFGRSFSLKDVAPALLGKEGSYADMAVGDGGEAQVAYQKIRDPKTPDVEKRELIEALIAYCRKDTELTRKLVAWLFAQI